MSLLVALTAQLFPRLDWFTAKSPLKISHGKDLLQNPHKPKSPTCPAIAFQAIVEKARWHKVKKVELRQHVVMIAE